MGNVMLDPYPFDRLERISPEALITLLFWAIS
jgi:bifunctional ADP-heptose synthase (sugar kinase/adenylyltransferase)